MSKAMKRLLLVALGVVALGAVVLCVLWQLGFGPALRLDFVTTSGSYVYGIDEYSQISLGVIPHAQLDEISYFTWETQRGSLCLPEGERWAGPEEQLVTRAGDVVLWSAPEEKDEKKDFVLCIAYDRANRPIYYDNIVMQYVDGMYYPKTSTWLNEIG